MDTIQRSSCVICGNQDLEKIHKIDNVPVYMGTTPTKDNFLFSSLEYVVCNHCKTLQLDKLIPLDILYKKSHNTDVVGKIWEDHNEEFMKFVSKSSIKTVMEIGDPSYKMVKASHGIFNFDRWYIVEPNVPKKYPENVEYINNIFDDNFKFEKKVDAFILSHSFEHMYNPHQVLNNILSILKTNGSIFISIPNMRCICNEKIMPPAGLHFEHSFYIDYENIKLLLGRVGLKITDIYFYKNHSIFFRCQEGKCDNNLVSIIGCNQSNNKNFKDFLNICNDNIKRMNKSMLNCKYVYLYGAHFPAQLLISIGLNNDKIIGVLDNSDSKIGQTLYGTDLKVFSPKHLLGKEEICVICEMGVYTEEIKQNILKINNKVKFI